MPQVAMNWLGSSATGSVNREIGSGSGKSIRRGPAGKRSEGPRKQATREKEREKDRQTEAATMKRAGPIEFEEAAAASPLGMPRDMPM